MNGMWSRNFNSCWAPMVGPGKRTEIAVLSTPFLKELGPLVRAMGRLRRQKVSQKRKARELRLLCGELDVGFSREAGLSLVLL